MAARIWRRDPISKLTERRECRCAVGPETGPETDSNCAYSAGTVGVHRWGQASADHEHGLEGGWLECNLAAPCVPPYNGAPAFFERPSKESSVQMLAMFPRRGTQTRPKTAWRLVAGALFIAVSGSCIIRQPVSPTDEAATESSSATAASNATPVPASGPGAWQPARQPAWGEEPKARHTTNLFVQLLGKSEAEVQAKLTTAVERFFGINTNESSVPTRMEGYKVYYELPQDPSMAFIWAAESNDVRSEGVSYGMTIAVQMNMQREFDRLWRFAKTYMQYPGDHNIPAWRYYFRWQGRVDVSNPDDWKVNYGPIVVPAPDGEEYFAAALYMADRRWGSSGDINYLEEAGKISWAMLNNPRTGDRFPLIHAKENKIVFVPYGSSNEHSDPSYHLPAFYELFAEYGPAEDSERWRAIAEISREYLAQSAHPDTGLHPDYAKFDGEPTQGYQSSKHDTFYYDAWRVPLNMALDAEWFGPKPRMKEQVEKYHAFFSKHLGNHNVSSALFNLDGSEPSGGGSTALTATLAAGALVSESPLRETFVENLWHVQQQSGEYRYYQQCVYLLGFLAAAGQFYYDWPSPQG